MKSNHSHCKRFYCTADSFKAQQTTLMHSRQLYCIAEGFTAESFNAQQKALLHNRKLYCTAGSSIAQQEALWQKALMHSRKLCCTAGSFIAQQEVLLHSKKVSPVAETGEKFLLWQKLERSSFCGKNWRKVPSATETKDKHHVLPAVSVLLVDKAQFAYKSDQIELQLDRSQLSYSEYLGLILQEVAQPDITKKAHYKEQ